MAPRQTTDGESFFLFSARMPRMLESGSDGQDFRERGLNRSGLIHPTPDQVSAGGRGWTVEVPGQ